MRLGCLALALLLGSCSAPPPADRGPRPEGTGTILVTVTGMPNDKGQVMINLFLEPKGFPNQPDLAFATEIRQPKDGKASARFADVPAGPFAIAILHDQDLDRELGTNFFGMPTEHWGISKDPSTYYRTPRFDDARLELKPGQQLDVPVVAR